MLGVFSLDCAHRLKSVFREVSSLIGGVSKPIRRIISALAALQQFMIDLETNERSALAIFTYGDHHAHALDLTLESNSSVFGAWTQQPATTSRLVRRSLGRRALKWWLQANALIEGPRMTPNR
jgi:hypothetical protein